MLFRSNDTATTEIYTRPYTLSLHDALPISGGMIPKVENCIDAVNSGVEAATILDGRVPHALLLEVFTESGVGTMVKRT